MELLVIAGISLVLGFLLGTGATLIRFTLMLTRHNYVCTDCGFKLHDAIFKHLEPHPKEEKTDEGEKENGK